MYTPAHFNIKDRERIISFIRDHSFGILFSADPEGVFHDTHLPLVISDNCQMVSGHIARANPQWKSWEAQSSVKLVFHGPHAYISPSFYQSDFNVPTWNYTAVSLSGEVSLVDERDEQIRIMKELVDFNEKSLPSPWSLDTSDQRYLKLFEALVFFQISVTGIEGKFKLNQNKSEEDRESVIRQLLASGSAPSMEIAEFMQRENEKA